jgi:L,D-transpeptidase ErfK/SrfK
MRAARRRVSRGVLIAACTLAFGAVIAGADIPQLAPRALDTGIVINVPQRLLFLMRDGIEVARYPVGLGRADWRTFLGPFTIVAKEVDPAWDVPKSIQEEQRRAGKPVITRIGPGPNNPLGKHWLGLSATGYGIHGTNAPASISTFQSHGCIRLLAADIADLFARVEVGTPGMSIYEPILLAVIGQELWLEAHRDVYRMDRRDPRNYVAVEAARLSFGASIDAEVIETVLRERDGRPHVIGIVGGREFSR